jgi:hypothetical protein
MVARRLAALGITVVLAISLSACSISFSPSAPSDESVAATSQTTEDQAAIVADACARADRGISGFFEQWGQTNDPATAWAQVLPTVGGDVAVRSLPDGLREAYGKLNVAMLSGFSSATQSSISDAIGGVTVYCEAEGSPMVETQSLMDSAG